MSVPFSNTHLRVPRGFGIILEGLAREILRDQPEDIPAYAALHFDALLKEREKSGMDPAEWAAKLEDRFYNNRAFKTSPTKKPATEMTITSEEKSYESQTEDEASNPVEVSSTSTTNTDTSKDVQGTEEKKAKEEKDVTDVEMLLSQEESGSKLPVTDVSSDELSGTEEEKDQTIAISHQVDRTVNENDGRSAADKDVCQSELEPTDFSSVDGNSNVDVCAGELGMTEDKGGQTFQKLKTNVEDEEIRDSTRQKQSTEVEETIEGFPYSGLPDVNLCAEEPLRTEKTVVEDNDTSDAHATEQDRSILQMEETMILSPLSQTNPAEANLQEMEDQEVDIPEGKGIENNPSEETHEILPTTEDALENMPQTEDVLDGDVAPKQESLVEISFEDVPEVWGITKTEEKPPEEESLVVSETEVLEIQSNKEFTGLEACPDVRGSRDHDEPTSEMDGAEKEVKAEGEEMTSQQEAAELAKEKVDASDSDSSDGGDDNGGGVKTISSPHRPSTETEEENLEDKTDLNNDYQDKEEASEVRSHQNEDSEIEKAEHETNDPDLANETDTGGEDIEDRGGFSEVEEKLAHEVDDVCAEVKNEKEAELKESETVEASVEILPEESEERGRTPVDLEPENTVQEIEGRSEQQGSKAEDHVEEGMIDSPGHRKSGPVGEESKMNRVDDDNQGEQGEVDDDNQGEHRPQESEKDTAEPGGNSGDKEECSRPQEEEDIMDIPLDDPEANKAAAKIQAGFRGHMTRKKMKPEDKAEGEEVSSSGEALNGSQGDTETGGSGAVERDDTSVPEQ